MEKEVPPSKKRILAAVRRLMHDGQTLLRVKPLDELAQSKWIERARNYLAKRMPEIHVPSPGELNPHDPSLLDPYKPQPHPVEAFLIRSLSCRELMKTYLNIVAKAQEALEQLTESEPA